MSGPALRQQRSLLDRLLEDGTDEALQSVRELQAAIQRDVQALLNARQPWASIPDRFGGLRESLLGYGLPDFAAGTFNAPAQRATLCHQISTAIKRFEPRLTDVSVSLLDRPENMDPILRVRIEAVLHIDGSHEAVLFETLLDSTTADLIVRSDTDG